MFESRYTWIGQDAVIRHRFIATTTTPTSRRSVAPHGEERVASHQFGVVVSMAS
jgi:hypothetical protein